MDKLIPVCALVFITLYVAASLAFSTPDHKVINQCKEKGWYNFGQTRIICSVEPEKK